MATDSAGYDYGWWLDDVSLHSCVPLTLSLNNVFLAEGNAGTRNFVFTLSQNLAATTDVTVTYATANGTAQAPADYTAISGTATIRAGTFSTAITVTVQSDTDFEPDETFTLNLSNPVGASILDGQGVGTITNDDSAPTPTPTTTPTHTPTTTPTPTFTPTATGTPTATAATTQLYVPLLRK
jgi:hypothetical protein